MYRYVVSSNSVGERLSVLRLQCSVPDIDIDSVALWLPNAGIVMLELLKLCAESALLWEGSLERAATAEAG
jgi:hypothetical protein